MQAPHLVVGVFARGLLKRAATRMYFPDEVDANAADPVLSRLDPEARATLVAVPEDATARCASTSASRAPDAHDVLRGVTAFAPIFAPAESGRRCRRPRLARARCSTPSARSRAPGAAAGIVPAEAAAADRRNAAASSSTTSTRPRARARAAGNPVEPLVRALAGGSVRPPAPTGSTAARRARTSSTRAAMLVASRASRLVLDRARRRGGALRARWPTRTAATAMAAPHAAAAGRADDVRAQGGGLARRRCSRRRRGSSACARSASRRSSAARPGRSPRSAPTGRRSPATSRASSGSREPTLPWHTNRVRVAELGAALAALAGACGKIGRDVALLAQTEVGEVAEAARAAARRRCRRSGTPSRSVLAVACARLVAAHASACSRARSCRSTSARPAPGTRSGRRSRVRCSTRAAPRRRCAARSRGSRSTRRGCARTSTATGGLSSAERVSFALADRIGPSGGARARRAS